MSHQDRRSGILRVAEMVATVILLATALVAVSLFANGLH